MGSWLEGPPRTHEGYPGQRLGMPATGRGSLATIGERLAAFAVDLLVAAVVTLALVQHPGTPGTNLASDGVFVVMTVGLLVTSGRTLGMRVVGLQVVRLDGRTVGVRALPRQLLFALLVPALIWNRDRRGLHELASGTAVVCVR